MVFTVKDWVLQVDIEKTLAYSSNILQDHCQCGYCRNYYAAIDMFYPDLRPFLAQLGSHVETPDELMPFEPTVYEATYCICGSIMQRGSEPIHLKGMSLFVLGQSELDFDTECPVPCFAFVTSVMELPWVLEEDMDEVISPANEPEYLQRMWSKLLQQATDDPIYS